ncbi:Signal transduction histidine kinase CheA [hydrothermal vent metagenome]|uniref:histidine kinase n=1 Tax=hydrothermal vent metagenome TaxID=652676 RepID=A0A3B0Y827_9ZZZZ
MLDHEHKSGEACTDSIKTLSDITSGFNNNETDSVAYLKQYKALLHPICNCLYTPVHESLPGLSAILLEGIDLLIAEKRALTDDEFSFLQTIPEIFSEYIFIPESKVPDARLLSHLKNRQWVRPLSSEEEKSFIKLLMSPPAKKTEASETEPTKKTGLSDTQNQHDSISKQNNAEADSSLVNHAINSETDAIYAQKNTLRLVTAETKNNAENKAPHKERSPDTGEQYSDRMPQRAEINLTNQQQDLINLICEELEDTIEDKTLCHIPAKLNASELNNHLTDISELIDDTSKALDRVPLSGLSNSCRVISINIRALASAKTFLPEQHKSLIEEWPLNILQYLLSISNKSETPLKLASKIIIQYLSDSSWPAILTDGDKSSLQSLLQAPQQAPSTEEDNATAEKTTTTEADEPLTSANINRDSSVNINESNADEYFSVNEDSATYNFDNGLAFEADENTQNLELDPAGESDAFSATDTGHDSFDKAKNISASASPEYESKQAETEQKENEDPQAEQQYEHLQTEQQQALSALICEELEETIKDATLCSIPGDISLNDLYHHLTDISELIEDTSKAIDMIALEGLSNSCRFISINVLALAKNRAELSEQQKYLIEKWPLHILLYMQSIKKAADNNNEAQHLVTYLSDNNWPVPLPADEVEYLQSLLTLSLQNKPADISLSPADEDRVVGEPTQIVSPENMAAASQEIISDNPPEFTPETFTETLSESFGEQAPTLEIQTTDEISVNTTDHDDIVIDADALISEHIEDELSEDSASTQANNNSDKSQTVEQVSQVISEQQKEAISLVSEELNEIIENESLGKIPPNINATELNTRLINIAELIEHMSNAIDILGLEGLGNCCRVTAINIHTLAASKKDLTEQQTSLIEEWPLHTLLYLQHISEANDYHNVAANKTDSLMQYINNDNWPYKLENTDKEKLQALLSSPELKDENNLQQHLSTRQKLTADKPDNIETDHTGTHQTNTHLNDKGSHSSTTDQLQATDSIEEPSIDQAIETIELGGFSQQATDFDDDAVNLHTLSESSEHDSEQPTKHFNTVTPDKPHSSPVTKEQQELITLISDELSDIIEDKTFCKTPADIDISELGDHLISIAELIEHMSNAIDMIGLEGLGNSCRIVSSNIHTLALEKKHLTEQQEALIEKWPLNILQYLQAVSEGSISDKDANRVILYIADANWPESIQTEQKLNVQSLLGTPHLKEEEKDIRQDAANENDISLVLPDDVNAELLEALLQDLPVQTEEFSSALENMQNQNDIEYLDVAQRIAHTLKGASNVVGVKGIANLTHHLEDILEIQSKANKIPSAELQTILSDAADCLETMSEHLLGISGPPDNGVEVFQSILDWANKLDIEGATDRQSDPSDAILPPSLLAVKTDDKGITPLSQANAPANNTAAEIMLRVPVTLADELLRITGENLISTSQIQEYLKTIKNRYRGLRTHNQSLQKLSFDLEHIIDIQGILNNGQSVDSENFDPLELNEFHELHAMSRKMLELAADSIELSQVLEKDLSQLQGLVISQDKLQKENQNLVLKTRMVPTKSIIPRLKRGVKQACRLTHKHVELEVRHNDTQMDSEVLQSMIEPLMHILRNAVDHGIEPAELRTDSGKPPAGLIKLTFTSEGDQIKIEIQDDGQGLSIDKIKNKAIKLGLIDEKKETATTSLQMLILHPGFSTRNEVNQVSGRGIGLDVVNSNIRELKGSLDIDSTHGHGCTFTLLLPVSSFSTQALLIRVRENTHTFSNRGIEEILYPGNGKILNLGHEIVFKYNGKIYNTCFIESLLNLPDDRRGINRHSCPVILVKEDTGGNMAVLVQEVIDSQNVVVKSMGPYIPKLPGIVGATVLGDGSISPVIDIPELLQSASSMPEYVKQQRIAANHAAAPSHLAYVLVVDDSLSARKSLAQFIEDLGMEVRTARDGMEAVSLIAARKPDLLLVDMEMPRMNGLELTSHIRADTSTHDIPVIMITSRSTEKHRQTAISRGVDHYMVKPFEEEELASHIQGVLKIA